MLFSLLTIDRKPPASKPANISNNRFPTKQKSKQVITFALLQKSEYIHPVFRFCSLVCSDTQVLTLDKFPRAKLNQL